MKIYKEKVFFKPSLLSMQPGSQIVHFGLDGHRDACIWFTYRETNNSEVRKFQIVGTGHEFPDPIKVHGSFVDGDFVWHLIELLP